MQLLFHPVALLSLGKVLPEEVVYEHVRRLHDLLNLGLQQTELAESRPHGTFYRNICRFDPCLSSALSVESMVHILCLEVHGGADQKMLSRGLRSHRCRRLCSLHSCSLADD